MKSLPGELSLPRITHPINARIRLPGSKSIANRALVAAALADESSTLHNLPGASDVEAMRECLGQLGVRFELSASDGRVSVDGCGGIWPAESAELDARDAGTVARLLAAVLCLGNGQYELDGRPRLRKRPMAALLDALRGLGAVIDCPRADNSLPIRVTASGLDGGQIWLDSPESSQFLSALLLAAPLARADVFIEVRGILRSRPYVTMTTRVMECFGTAAIDEGGKFIVPAGQRYRGGSFEIEPDASAASYFWALAAISGGACRVVGLTRDSVQGDIRMLEFLTSMGCSIIAAADGTEVRAPADGRLRAFDADVGDTPDLAPTLAVLAAFADGPSRLRGAPHLRLKESDRIASLAAGLQRIGADSEIHDDGLTVRPAAKPAPAAIDTFDDHRVAMAFALAAARIDGMVIRDPDCVRKSLPEFWGLWDAATARD